MNNTLNLLNTSLTKLDLILEEIQLELLVLEKMNTNTKNDDLVDIIDGFEKISNKLLKLRANTSNYMNKLEYIDIVNKSMEYALKLKNSVNTEVKDKSNNNDDKTKKNSVKNTYKNATYTESVDFTPIEHTNIGHTVGELPIECTYIIPGVCDVKLEITRKKTVIVKEGSFICKSNKKDINNIESNRVRELRTGWSYLGECAPNNSHLRGSKIYVIKDIILPSVDTAKMFILGRNLRASDSKYDFKVDNINLKDYLNIGYNT